MYWDVVEVKPEPEYRLFVRFKDGLAGRVQLRREELTGALAPLLDMHFFQQAFIDSGAVAWPGQIDLAPDAMYTQVARQIDKHKDAEDVAASGPFRSQLPRFFELKDLLIDPFCADSYFQDFEQHLADRACFATFARWEGELQSLDTEAWGSLKSKASYYVSHGNKNGRAWQQLFDVLGEALAYNYLRRIARCTKVRFIDQSDKRTPDLEGILDHERILCEVKTINISEDEVGARRTVAAVRQTSNQLGEGFFRKLDSDIRSAKDQLQTYDATSESQHLVYFNVCFDDFFALYEVDYLQQIEQHLLKHPPEIKVIVNSDVSETEARVLGERSNTVR